MTRNRLVAGAVLTAAALAMILQVLPSAAQEPVPIVVEELTPRSEFTDNVDLKAKVKERGEHRRIVANDKDPSRTVVARITLQPDAEFPWHSHPGPVIVNVVSGELTYQGSEHCRPRAYPAGTAFLDPGFGHVHNAWNSGRGQTVIVATFFSAPPEGSLLIPAEEQCGG
jgi:quercetin dioxygenase-like cupin family protein